MLLDKLWFYLDSKQALAAHVSRTRMLEIMVFNLQEYTSEMPFSIIQKLAITANGVFSGF
eukprot:scaffold628_cov91-Cylindrotheca_fusiformis.AAC.8